MSQTQKHSSPLPSVMQGKLRSIRRRQGMLAALRALTIGLTALIAAMILAMAVDWAFTLFDTRLRLTLTTLALLLTAGVLLVAGLPPLLKALRWMHAAADADQVVPQLQERWTTVANFAVSEHQPTSPAARAMLQQVTSEAAAMERLVQPSRVARPAALKPAALTLAGCLLALAGFLSLNWPQTSVLLQRFWAPTADISATRLNSLTGDVTIPRGEMLELKTKMSGLPRTSATLDLHLDSGIVDVFDLEPDDNEQATFAYSLRAEDSFRYRVRAGDGQTAWHDVTVVDYPELAEVRFTITPPEYVDRPVYEKQLIPGRVKVVQGSRLNLAMQPVAPLERMELTLSLPQEQDEPIVQQVSLVADADGWYRYESQLLSDLSLRPTLWNAHGLTNEQTATCRIQVIADKAPVARVVSPTDEMAVAVDDVIDIAFEAHDDFGIASAELVIYDESATREGEEPQVLAVQPIPLGDQQLQQHVMASTQLNLKELGLEAGAQISYAVRVSDNREVQIDPESMQPQRSEAGPGDAKTEDAQLADADRSDDPQMRNQTAAAAATKPEAQNEPDDARQMLAAAGNPTSPKATSNNATDSERPTADEPSNNAATKANPRAPAEPDADSQPDESTKAGDDTSPTSGESPKGAVAIATPKEQPDGDKPAEEEAAAGASTPDTSGEDARSREKSVASAEPMQERDTPLAPGGAQPSETSPSAKTADSQDADGSGQPGKGDRTLSEEAADLASQEAVTAAADQPVQDGKMPDAQQTAALPSGTRMSEGDPDATLADNNARQPGDAPARTGNATGEEEGSQPIASAGRNAPTTENTASPANLNNRQTGSQAANNSANRSSSPPVEIAMLGQQSESGQNTETSRRKLKITDRLSAVAQAQDRRAETEDLRDRVVAIDRMLAQVEAGLTQIIDRRIPDADHNEQYRRLDVRLGEVESYIGKLREETQDEQFAFVGLQMVDIGRTHVTPARDRVFTAIRDAGGARRNATDALQHVVRARELLAALLKRYDRVARDRQLADALEESVKMYEVYIEKRHKLMREARQNKNPLERKMSVIEVDQEYLDRYAEVLTLRREMLAEFARMLADDPRLLARYLDQLKRRRSSLRDQLAELSQRQYEQATELSGWRAVSQQQRDNLWRLLAEMRMQAATPLAADAAELAERIEKQLPLALEPTAGTPARVLQHAQEIARIARTITFDVRGLIQQGERPQPQGALTAAADQLTYQFSELEAALDQLNFEHETDVEVTSYVTGRLLESRAVADQADAWAQIARHIEQQQYPGLAQVDQQKTAIATELLRVDMLEFESDLETQFQRVTENDVPGEIIDLVRQLHRIMEGITFDQTAATFALSRESLESAERRQARAVARFDEAEQLFDRIRRAVIAELDQYDEDDPNIADLEDPTLDEFLAQLEREPNIQAQLGIPNRPRNLRVLVDVMTNAPPGGAMLGDSESAAMRRAKQAMRMQRKAQAQSKPPPPETEMTDEQREQRKQEQQMQQTLEKSLAALQKKIEDPQTTAEQRRKLEQMAQNMQRMIDQMEQQNPKADDWQRIVESDQAQAMLRALASGETLPDEQWNKLLSTLDDGLWQVRGSTPPEEYRRAIEQYQDRIRQLMDTIVDDAA